MTRQPQRLVTGATEIVFEWAGDRWRHIVRPVAGGGRTIATSLEGFEPGVAEGDPRWPVSPVIVEVMAGPVAAAAAPTLLGVGAAGRSHYSLAVTAHPVVGDAVLVEIACRVHEPPGPLGSTYRLGHGADDVVVVAPEPGPEPAGLPRTIRWSYALGPAGIMPGGGTTLRPPAAG